jgi:hypothetical protein
MSQEMVTKFDHNHNLVMTEKPSTKVTLEVLANLMIVSVIPEVCRFLSLVILCILV